MINISKSVPKVDHEEKASGKSLFVSDIKMDGMLYAKTVRSIHPRAKIIKITLPELPSGYFIVDKNDIPNANYVKIIFEDWKVFADQEVNYIGEPILIVVGKNRQKIDEIIKKIVIDYKILKPIFDYKKSVIHKEYKKGNVKDVFKNKYKKIIHEYSTGYQEQAYIEPQGFLCYPEEKGKITLIGSIQCPYYVHKAVALTLGCDDDMVRVIQPSVGGAFGGKEEYPSLLACQLAVAVKKIGSPIKMILEREEDISVTTKRHPSKIKLEASIDSNHRILGLKAHVSLDSGAAIGLSGVVLSRAMIAATSAYTIENLAVSGDVYYTNTVPTGAFRGFGAPQMIFAIEMFMNHIAKELEIDPFIFRMNHLAKQNDFTSTNGIFRDPIIMREMIEKATQESNYHEKVLEYQDPNVYKGIGMSWFLHGCGFTGSGESKHIHAKVKIKKDSSNHVYILVAAVDMGQGVKTTLKKIVVETLGISYDLVSFDNPDTDFIVDSGPTVASRTIMIVGGLLARAAKRLKDIWEDQKEMEVIEDYVQPSYISWDEEKFIGDAYPAYSWGVNIVEVEVSPITYQVKPLNIWSVYDVGKAIDERIVLGQADGGILQGIAYGYMEVMTHEQGRIKQKNLTDYIIPTALDMPKSKNFLYENPYALGPYGAKGVGELTLVGGAPAIALAIEQAINKKIFKIPASPEYLMELMNDD
ncbi:MAG: xanthine dehydrogenase family protein molybdopterin-binding subunit [Acholeplasmataceae bacterium]|nr:xanthine dehydrogenase family protein molybdopterin-binding subunit [Acholeplasmataceae bacterium]